MSQLFPYCVLVAMLKMKVTVSLSSGLVRKGGAGAGTALLEGEYPWDCGREEKTLAAGPEN